MKFKKIFGLSIFTASVLGFIACANNHPAEIYNNEDFYQDHSTNPTANDGYCLLTFDANGGKLPDGRSSTYFQVRKGHNWKRIKDKHGIPPEDGEGMTPVANKEFKFWQTKDNKAIFDEYVFNEDSVTLTAKWGDAYEPTAFSSDPWDQVVEAANKGNTEEGLQKYSSALKNNSFIIEDLNDKEEVKSKTRYVNIEGLINPLYGEEGYEDIKNPCDWPVHVIGVDHDLIKDSPKTAAALTFEFNYSPIPAIGWDYSSEVGHQSWEKSSLREYLNSYFYLQFEDGLQSGVQTVCKNTDDGTNQDNITSIEEKIFIPSVSEVGDGETLAYNATEASSYENSRYQYYALHNDPKDLVKTNPYVLVEGAPSSTTTWFRSPHLLKDVVLQDSSAMTISLNEEGTSHVITNEEVNVPHAVCPCFAIGENPVCAVVANMGEGLTFEATDNFAQIGTDFVARLKSNDPFSGYRPPIRHGLDGKIKITINGETKVLVSGQDFTYTPGNPSKLKIKSSAILEGATLITIDADPVADKFQTDSWETVVAKANEGVDAFVEYYGLRGSSGVVGLEKYLTIDGIKYRTRIIDYGYDPLADDTGTAALTFEFVDAIDAAGVYDNETNENFPGSELNFRLSSFAQDKIPFELTEVKKPVHIKDENEKWTMVDYNAKLFPLSNAENNSDRVDLDTDFPYEWRNNECYDYYKNGTGHSIGPKYLPGTNIAVPIWLRTPYAKENLGLPVAISIDENGFKARDALCTDAKYVAPGFCIGRNYVTSNITFSGATNAFTIDNDDPETIKVPVDHSYTISKISAKEIGGKTPTITKDNVFLTANGSIFTDWDLISYGDNDYDIVLNNVPTSGVDVNITFPTQYLSVKIDKKSIGEEGISPVKIGFVKGDSAPDTQLSYSNDGINFIDYTYGTMFQLNELSDKVYFKAKRDANNATFSSGISNFSSYDNLDGHITQFVTEVGFLLERAPCIQVEGNIMSLLGDGISIPSTIDARGAFAGMFSNNAYVGDISGLTFTATGTSRTDSDASGTYAYMFYNCDHLYCGPAKITGFNNYSVTNTVESTYRGMFASSPNTDIAETHADINFMPYCDFSKTCPHMCEEMFAYCPYLVDLDNVVTDQFNYDYSEACFLGMFKYAGFNYVQGFDIEVPAAIGSEEMDAANNCCSEMFEGAMIRKSPNMICNTPAEQSFFRCFANCRALTELSLTINEVGAGGSQPYGKFAALDNGVTPLEESISFDLYLYGLSGLTSWPGGDFTDWINGRDSRKSDVYQLHTNSNVKNAMDAYGHGSSSVFENWKYVPLTSMEVGR